MHWVGHPPPGPDGALLRGALAEPLPGPAIELRCDAVAVVLGAARSVTNDSALFFMPGTSLRLVIRLAPTALRSLKHRH